MLGNVSRVLVTGAAGHLGSHVVPLLAANGLEVRALDVVDAPSPPPTGCSFFKMDLADKDAVREVMKGCDLIVHCASIIPSASHKDEEYVDNNIKGTWTVYVLAAELGIDRIVLTSSVNAIGNARIPHTAWPVREDDWFSFALIYCLTKHTQEDIARHFADWGKVRTIALRPSTFTPSDKITLGFGLLHGRYTVVEDMAAAHLAAVEVMCGQRLPGAALAPFEAFNTTYQPPYTRDAAEELGPGATAADLLRKYWPDRFDWLLEQGYGGGDMSEIAVYDNSKAQRILGWRAEYTAEKWFADMSAEAGSQRAKH